MASRRRFTRPLRILIDLGRLAFFCPDVGEGVRSVGGGGLKQFFAFMLLALFFQTGQEPAYLEGDRTGIKRVSQQQCPNGRRRSCGDSLLQLLDRVRQDGDAGSVGAVRASKMCYKLSNLSAHPIFIP